MGRIFYCDACGRRVADDPRNEVDPKKLVYIATHADGQERLVTVSMDVMVCKRNGGGNWQPHTRSGGDLCARCLLDALKVENFKQAAAQISEAANAALRDRQQAEAAQARLQRQLKQVQDRLDAKNSELQQLRRNMTVARARARADKNFVNWCRWIVSKVDEEAERDKTNGDGEHHAPL